MNTLSTAEKKAHHQAMTEYVGRLNRQLMPAELLDRIELRNVAYGIKVEDAYFYFDFPYSVYADRLNSDLKHHTKIRGLDELLHKKFKNKKRFGTNGFIAYTYTFDQVQKVYQLMDAQTNLDLDEVYLRSYLPIVDCAIVPKDTYLSDVISAQLVAGADRVLVLCSWPHVDDLAEEPELEQIDLSPARGNLIITTFSINTPEVKVEQALVDLLHDRIIYFVNNYFNSPVAQKIMDEQRKSEVLAYHHSIDNLELDSYINFLENILNGGVVDKETLRRCVLHLRVLRLLHYLLFQVEYLKAREGPMNTRHEVFELANKTITELIGLFIEKYNLQGVRYDLQVDTGLTQLDFKPATGGIDNPDPEFYDLVLILWNLLQNAAIMADSQPDKGVGIKCSEDQGQLRIAITNMGKMPIHYLRYISAIEAEYPQLYSNPNKRYRGLEIVKDKCRSYNRRWQLDAEVHERPQGWYTTVSLTL